MSKILIAYFSHAGMNYVDGRIVDLPVGNTRVAAEKIAAATGGDLFEIRAVHAYPHAYDACTRAAKSEREADARPALQETIDVSWYDTIVLAFPNWWGTMPMPVFTFLESGDFSGKTVLPLCTHEGSGLGNSERDIKKLCPASEIKIGLALRGSIAAKSDAAIQTWLNQNYKETKR